MSSLSNPRAVRDRAYFPVIRERAAHAVDSYADGVDSTPTKIIRDGRAVRSALARRELSFREARRDDVCHEGSESVAATCGLLQLAPSQCLQRLMRGTTGPEAVRAVAEALLVDRLPSPSSQMCDPD